jgi:hypothetical protein
MQFSGRVQQRIRNGTLVELLDCETFVREWLVVPGNARLEQGDTMFVQGKRGWASRAGETWEVGLVAPRQKATKR